MPKKLLFIGHSSRLDGAERCYLESVKSLKLQGLEVIAILPSEGPLCEKLKALNVDYQLFEFPRWMKAKSGNIIKKLKFYLWQLKLTKKFQQVLASINPDVVVTNTIVISPFAAIASKAIGIPHFWYVHEFGDKDHGLTFTLGPRWSGKIISKYSQKVLVNSGIIKEHFRNIIDPEKMRLLHYAVENEEKNEEIDLQTPKKNDHLKVLLLGRMFANKGQEEAILGLHQLIQKGYKAELTLVGGGKIEFKEHLKSLAKKLDIDHYIHVIDFTPEPMKYMEETDLVLMCSKKEAFGRVTVEAMKMGKPVIGADSGATPEIINDGVTGKIYKLGNPEDLANKIVFFIDNKDQLEIMGAKAKEWSLKHFNYQQHGQKFLAILNEN